MLLHTISFYSNEKTWHLSKVLKLREREIEVTSCHALDKLCSIM